MAKLPFLRCIGAYASCPLVAWAKTVTPGTAPKIRGHADTNHGMVVCDDGPNHGTSLGAYYDGEPGWTRIVDRLGFGASLHRQDLNVV